MNSVNIIFFWNTRQRGHAARFNGKSDSGFKADPKRNGSPQEFISLPK